jgi:hypothetical protein
MGDSMFKGMLWQLAASCAFNASDKVNLWTWGS